MTSPTTDLQAPPPPSLSRLARTTAIALIVAGVLLVTVVLPAEYAIDPTGVGRWLGLTEIAAPSIEPVEVRSPDGALAPVQNGPVGAYRAEFKLDVFEVVLGPYEYIEYKYQLEKGATMLYAWTASAPVIQDFHGERPSAASGGEPAEESFDKENRRHAAGSFAAPFAGIHGWYWENPGAEPITIRLTTSGFYSSAMEIRSDRSRSTHVLRPIDTLSPDDPAGTAPRARQPTGDRK